MVRFIVGSDGRLRCPEVVRSLPNPSLSVEVLESVYEWEFEPATVDGEPFEAFYELTTNFELK